MPLIGDELRTILGMMPVRDRAGIARGTMADDAMKASAAAEQGNGNAEGQALTMQGMRPPQIQLPPMGGPGAADVTLPDDVATEYASGRKKTTGAPYGYTPLPIPAERVVTSSPAAAPSAAVATRASDVALAAMQQRERQQKMMQLVGSIGLIANAFNRNPQSQASTRSSLSDMMGGGGGGGNALQEIKTLADMRAAEDKSIIDAQNRERGITQGMLAHGLTRERATYLYDSGALADRDKPAEMREAQKIRDDEIQKKRLRPMAAEIAKARGTDVRVIEALIEDKPSEAAKLAEAAGIEELRGKRLEGDKKEIDIATELQEMRAWKTRLDRLTADPNATPAQIIEAARSPAATKAGLIEEAKRGVTLDDAERTKIFNTYVEKERPEGKAAETYLTHTAKAIGETWHPNITTGTISGFRQMVARAAQTAGLSTTPDLNDTAAINSLLKNSAIESLRAMGGNDSNVDLLHANAVKGSTQMGPMELRSVAVLNEKSARAKLEKVNAERAANAQHPDAGLRSKFNLLLSIPMPEPSKLLMADIYHPAPQLRERNQQLRSRLETYRQQFDTNPNAATEKQYRDVERRFNEEYGAGVAEYYITQRPR